ncbi:MAG: hypothetical protein P0Y62_16775 [Candidatus Chryseobacterium colombiense]|nr:hypothetical protein [Chryseobacterium sp.]WEK69476.1 MAG: hypothetical protein P0Y62_16775 [Chryseobacterium sp.]
MNNDKDKTEELLSKIKIFNETAWDYKVSVNKINLWLENFAAEERESLLFLLTQFIFFSKFQVNNMLKSIYRDFIEYSIVENFRINNSNTLDKDSIEKNLEETLNKTRFVPIGNPSESSASLMYDFRTINKLKTSLFIEQGVADSTTDTIENFIFIDDICGSGNQVRKYAGSIVTRIKSRFPSAKIHYYTLVANQKGIDYISGLKWFSSIDSVIRLDDSYKCFESNSRFFKNHHDIDVNSLKTVCEKQGYKLMASILEKQGIDEKNAIHCQLGYDNNQLLLGFDHNTPDNTLPIIWYDEDMVHWSPIFPRKHKIY